MRGPETQSPRPKRGARAGPGQALPVRLVRRLMEHGVLMSVTGLGCLSTPMGDAELEGLVETFAAVLELERGTVHRA